MLLWWPRGWDSPKLCHGFGGGRCTTPAWSHGSGGGYTHLLHDSSGVCYSSLDSYHASGEGCTHLLHGVMVMVEADVLLVEDLDKCGEAPGNLGSARTT